MGTWMEICASSLTEKTYIGKGSFGIIYKARHSGLNLDVAVKIIKNDESRALEDLLSEAKKIDAASRILHVIQLIGILDDIWEGQQCYGIVMEYMERGTLHSLLKRSNLVPWALKFRTIHEVALGMNWLHSLTPPLLHLDLKASNVLLDIDLHAKISDFGLSQFIHNDSKSVEEGGGTHSYMPPEAFQKEYVPTIYTDVYSFAILSSVVLKQDEPYLVDNTELIRNHVYKGNRPSLEPLKEHFSVMYLNQAILFIEQCWTGNKCKRPTFKQCSQQWEVFYSAHKPEISDAVKEVVDQMNKAEAADSPTESTGAACSSSVAEVNSKLQNLHITQNHSVKQKTPPPSSSPQPVGKSNSKTSRANPEPKVFGDNSGHTTPNAGNSFQEQTGFYPPPRMIWPEHPLFVPTSIFNISGNSDGVQIGNNNVINKINRRQNQD